MMKKPDNPVKAAPAAFFDRISLTSLRYGIIVFIKGVMILWTN